MTRISLKIVILSIVMVYQLFVLGGSVLQAQSNKSTITSMPTIEQRLTNIQVTSSSLQTKIDDLDRRISKIESIDLEHRLTKLETEADTIHEVLNTVAAGVILLVIERLWQIVHTVKYSNLTQK